MFSWRSAGYQMAGLGGASAGVGARVLASLARALLQHTLNPKLETRGPVTVVDPHPRVEARAFSERLIPARVAEEGRHTWRSEEDSLPAWAFPPWSVLHE